MLQVFAFLTKGRAANQASSTYETTRAVVLSLAPRPPGYKRKYVGGETALNREDPAIDFDVDQLVFTTAPRSPPG